MRRDGIDSPAHAEATKRLARAAYEYGFTQVRRLRDLGYEPRLTDELRWLLIDDFEERFGAATDFEDIVDAGV